MYSLLRQKAWAVANTRIQNSSKDLMMTCIFIASLNVEGQLRTCKRHLKIVHQETLRSLDTDYFISSKQMMTF